MSDALSRNRSFIGHVGAQFFGAFNDNLFKQLILFLAAGLLFPGEDKQGLAFAVFSLPFILFSGMAGDLSERLSKRRIIVSMKVAELAIMLVGALALHLQNWTLMLVVLFVMGAQSAFFGPAKYGVIPEIVARKRLLPANGVITMTTFMAIVLGQALAGPLLDNLGDQLWMTGAACAGFSVIGIAVAMMIRPLQPTDPSAHVHLNPFAGVRGNLKELAGDDPRVVPMLMMNSLFWFNGGVIQQAITGIAGPGYLDIPADDRTAVSILLVVLAIAIILGSVAVPQVAKVLPRGKLVMIGAIGMVTMEWTLTVVISAMGADAYVLTAVCLGVMGFTGAFFAVPVQTFLQAAPSEGMRGKAFAINNFLNFTLIFGAGIFYIGTTAAALHPGAAMGIAGSLQLALVLHHRKVVESMRPESDEP